MSGFSEVSSSCSSLRQVTSIKTFQCLTKATKKARTSQHFCVYRFTC